MARSLVLYPRRSPWEDTSKASSEMMLVHAHELFGLGFNRASGCMSRMSIDLALTKACAKRQIWPKHPITGESLRLRSSDKVNRLALTLVLADLVSDEFRRHVKRAMARGNAAAHARAFTPADACMMIHTAMRAQELLHPSE